MKNTVFRNASGLPNPEQVTTARDMAILAAHVIRDFPEYYAAFRDAIFHLSRPEATATTTASCSAIKGTDGIKTGYTRAAASTSPPRSSATTSISWPSCSAARPAPSATPPCGPCSTNTSPKAIDRKAQASVAQRRGLATPERTKPLFAMAAAAPKLALASARRKATGSEAAARPVKARPAPVVAADPQRHRPHPRAAGPYHVQVGAFTSQAEAENRLGEVQQRATNLLDGHQPVTATFRRTRRNGTGRASPASRRTTPRAPAPS